MKENKNVEELKERLLYRKRSLFESEGAETVSAAMSFAEDYKAWLDRAKTEREATREMVTMLRAAGFSEYSLGDPVKPGDRLFCNNRGKNLFVITVGSEPITEGVRICASHIDSPRLDLKPLPLFESEGVGYFKTHYYGGIKKYQWTTIPLALHGVVTRPDGSTFDITVGEDAGDPVFCISDLLPHLAKDQSAKKLSEAITGEGLNIMVCSSPYMDGDTPVTDDGVKLCVMNILSEKYGMTEDDFITAELTAVPAGRSVDIGFDRWLIGGYGHDDRCCAYPSLRAIMKRAEEGTTKHTNIVVFADKEETGSCGVSGMESVLLSDIIDSISSALGADPAAVRSHSHCLSADVSAAYDPNYPEVYEKRNSALLHCGVALAKYTGARGKSGTNETTSEYAGFVRNLFDSNDVLWQMAELGRVDQGGGGTVAMFISHHNIDTIDIGVPVLSMHAPFEIISKADLYEAYRAFYVFLD